MPGMSIGVIGAAAYSGSGTPSSMRTRSFSVTGEMPSIPPSVMNTSSIDSPTPATIDLLSLDSIGDGYSTGWNHTGSYGDIERMTK